jgi:hypothetical protein
MEFHERSLKANRNSKWENRMLPSVPFGNPAAKRCAPPISFLTVMVIRLSSVRLPRSFYLREMCCATSCRKTPLAAAQVKKNRIVFKMARDTPIVASFVSLGARRMAAACAPGVAFCAQRHSQTGHATFETNVRVIA